MKQNKEVKKPSICVFDYETSPAQGYFFGKIWETNIIKVIEHETIICASWMEIDGKVHNIAQWDFPDYKKGKWNDKSLVKYFREVLLKYDIIAGQNSDAFDIKIFNARLAYWGFDPLPEQKTFDTKKIAKSKLKLPSYSLDYMTSYFELKNKYHHSGMDMWFDCRDGVKKAQKEMTHYCNIDVIATRDLLLRLLPFAKISNEYSRMNVDLNCSNPNCLSKDLFISNKRRVIGGYKNQYQCRNCHKYTTDNKLADE